MTNDVPAGRFAITVDWPTGKETVEVSGLGVFPNHQTTELTEEQVYQWFNRTGANPLAQFPEGITVAEVDPKTPRPEEEQLLLDFPPKDTSTAEQTAETKKDGA